MSSPMYGACGTYRARRDVPSFWLGEPEEKRPFGRSRRRYEDNITMNLQDIYSTTYQSNRTVFLSKMLVKHEET